MVAVETERDAAVAQVQTTTHAHEIDRVRLNAVANRDDAEVRGGAVGRGSSPPGRMQKLGGAR
jgi:hypothetical protein